jgi:hypothetical protein
MMKKFVISAGFHTCYVERAACITLVVTRGVGCMDVGEALLPYRNATNIFLQI